MDDRRRTMPLGPRRLFPARGAARWRGACLALAALAAVLASFATAALPVPPAIISQVGAGMFLIAQEQIRDPRFQKTVILITAHDVHGTMGLIINRPTALRLREALPQVKGLEGRQEHLFVGGPVDPHALFTVIRTRTRPRDALQVMAKTYVAEGLSGLKAALADTGPDTAMRNYVGYTGWGAGQLDAEIQRGDWLVVEADSSAIFDMDPATVWPDFMRRYGGKWI